VVQAGKKQSETPQLRKHTVLVVVFIMR